MNPDRMAFPLRKIFQELKSMATTTLWRCFFLALALIASGGAALGQSYPSRPVRVVLPVPPGGGVDALGRIVAQQLSDALGERFIAENRPGASTVIGSTTVARATPDGYTLLVNAALFITGPLISKNVPYDPVTDFVPVTQIAGGPLLMVASAKLPAANLAEFIAMAKARPGEMSIANPGTGSTMDFAQAMFRLKSGIKVITPAYNGTGPAVTDVMTGQVSATFTTAPSALSLVKSGRLKVLGVPSKVRSTLIPEMPTISESAPPDLRDALADFEFINWSGLWAPAKTPKDIVDKLQRTVAQVVQRAEVRQLLASQGLEPVASTPEHFAGYIRNELAKHARLIKDAGLKFD
jgi:tripartite-type tricarboxylate transporter receptor subunit TctC